MYWSLDKMVNLMLEASQIALIQRESLEIREKNTSVSSQQEIYTNSDIAVEHFFCSNLTSAAQPSFTLGEESAEERLLNNDMNTMFTHTTWVIDPIDGTRNYANGLPIWGISVGYIDNLEFKEGAVALPDLNELLISDNGVVYYYKSTQSFLTIPSIDSSELQKLSYKTNNHNHKVWVASNAKQIHRASTRYSVHIILSCVYSIAKVITNNYFAYLGKAKIWDLAACIALFRNMQKPVYYHDVATNSVKEFPWKITDDFWDKNLSYTKKYLLFCHEKELGMQVLPQNS